MTTLRVACHNQGDKAVSPTSGWDVQCLSERSPAPEPNWAERHTSRRLKGLAIDWNPDVLDVRHKGSELAHFGRPGVTPNRGRLWIEASMHEPPYYDIAVVCSHRINDNDGSEHRLTARLRRRLWNRAARGDHRLFVRLQQRGFLVFYGGDINDRSSGLNPLKRLLAGHYDALGYTPEKRLKFDGVTPIRSSASDHARFTATYQIKEK